MALPYQPGRPRRRVAATAEVRLTRWIADQITKRCDHQITPALLQSWLRAWPWILILDGLDEVTQATIRRRLIEIIDEFIADADDIDADLMVVVTTRPSGFTERFASEGFAELHLLPLEPLGATAFASLVIKDRLADDPERRDTVEQRLAIAQTDPAQQRLMETPLQVLIMSFIHERFATLPSHRYRLFTRTTRRSTTENEASETISPGGSVNTRRTLTTSKSGSVSSSELARRSPAPDRPQRPPLRNEAGAAGVSPTQPRSGETETRCVSHPNSPCAPRQGRRSRRLRALLSGLQRPNSCHSAIHHVRVRRCRRAF